MENDTAVQPAHTEIAQQVHIELRKKKLHTKRSNNYVNKDKYNKKQVPR